VSNDIDLYDVAEQIVRDQLEIERLTARVQENKSLFREGSSTDLEREGRPTFIVKVTSNTRIDDKLAKEHLAPEVYRTVSKTVVDTAKARAFLSDEELSIITKHYENKVEVKLG
jgi:hypothetical protein